VESFDVYDDQVDSLSVLRQSAADRAPSSLTICVRGRRGSAGVSDSRGVIQGHGGRRRHFRHSSAGHLLTLVYRRRLPQLSDPDPSWIYFRFPI